jgi:hypothetical protein
VKDSEDNHLLVRDGLHALSVIPIRYEHVPIWRTHGKYRKQMKRGYSKLLYNQRNKDETIMSVIKRLFGEHIMSKLTRTQNRELSFKRITYNMHRLTNLVILMMFSIKPSIANDLNIISFVMYLMKKAFSIASAMVFLALLLATGIGLTHPANACPNNPSGTAGMNGNPTSPSSPSTQIAQPSQPLQSQSV